LAGSPSKSWFLVGDARERRRPLAARGRVRRLPEAM